MNLAKDGDEQRIFVKTMMNICGTEEAGNFLSSEAVIGFSGRTVRLGASQLACRCSVAQSFCYFYAARMQIACFAQYAVHS